METGPTVLAYSSDRLSDALPSPDVGPSGVGTSGAGSTGVASTGIASNGVAARCGSSAAAEPGPSARTGSLHGEPGSIPADLEPGRLLGTDAASLHGDRWRLERPVVAAETLLAPRIAKSGHQEAEGHRSPCRGPEGLGT
jgi:hypothetical protein